MNFNASYVKPRGSLAPYSAETGHYNLTAYNLTPTDLMEINFLSNLAYATWVDFKSAADVSYRAVFVPESTVRRSRITEKPYVRLFGVVPKWANDDEYISDFRLTEDTIVKMLGGTPEKGPISSTLRINHKIDLPHSPTLADIAGYTDKEFMGCFPKICIPLVGFKSISESVYESILPGIEKYIKGKKQ